MAVATDVLPVLAIAVAVVKPVVVALDCTALAGSLLKKCLPTLTKFKCENYVSFKAALEGKRLFSICTVIFYFRNFYVFAAKFWFLLNLKNYI
jgi:hypothetical protein